MADTSEPRRPADPPVPAGTDEEVFKRFIRKMGHDLLRYLPAVAVPAAVSVLYVAVFTRVFDPVEFGRYSVVFATCTLLVAVCSGWIAQSVVRYLPRYREEGRLEAFKAMLSALVLAVTAVLVVVAAPVGAARQLLGDYRPYFLPAAVLVVTGVAYTILRAVFTANLQAGPYARVEIEWAVLRLTLALGFVFAVSRSAVGLIVGPAAAYALLLAPMSLRLGLPAAVARQRRDFRLTLLPEFLRYGVPMVGWSIGVKVFEVSDRYVIEYFRGASEVGIYSANYNLVSMAIWLVASPALMTAHPLIVSAWEGSGRSRIQELIAAFSRYYFLCAAPVAVYAGVFARDITRLLLGEEYQEGHAIVPIVTLGLLFWNMGFYGHKGIKLLEKTGLMFASVTACALANIALNFALVPTYGYRGAAVATLVSALLYPVIVYFVTKRYLPWRVPWGAMARIAAAAAAAGAAAFGATSALPVAPPALRLAVGAIVGAAAYLGALAALGALEPYERAFIASAFRKRG